MKKSSQTPNAGHYSKNSVTGWQKVCLQVWNSLKAQWLRKGLSALFEWLKCSSSAWISNIIWRISAMWLRIVVRELTKGLWACVTCCLLLTDSALNIIQQTLTVPIGLIIVLQAKISVWCNRLSKLYAGG